MLPMHEDVVREENFELWWGIPLTSSEGIEVPRSLPRIWTRKVRRRRKEAEVPRRQDGLVLHQTLSNITLTSFDVLRNEGLAPGPSWEGNEGL